jgi:ubiquinone/menaquinone biosynthesis C-methylase UbiE
LDADQRMVDYYSRRAAEYETIYRKPERQRDLAILRDRLPRMLSGAELIEVACGTGYWTEVLAPAARSIVATDRSEEVLRIARSKS